MTIQELDTLLDGMDQQTYEREFGADETAEQYDAFGPGGWTASLIEQYESDLEAAGVPDQFDF